MSVVIYRPVLSDSYRMAGDDPTGEEAKAVAKQTCLAAIQAAKDAVSEWEAATLRFLQPVAPPPDAPVELSDRDKAIVIAAVLSTLDNAHSERIAELEAARDGLEGALRDAVHEQMRIRNECNQTLNTMAKSLDAKSAELDAMRAERDAARKEADELRARLDRADRFLQEHTTLLKQLEERMRQVTQPVGRSTMPTVPPRVGYRYERRDGTECEIDTDYGNGVSYCFESGDGRTYLATGSYGCSIHHLDLVREIGPIEQGDAK